MDPILSTELAAAHRAELLRTAAARRRTATAGPRHPELLSGTADRVRAFAARLRRPVTAPAPAACCA